MKSRLIFLLIKIFLAGALLIGLILVWAFLQSFETLTLIFNQLASDGELESFTIFLYHLLRIPFVLVGFFLVILASFLLLRWKKTEIWIHEFPSRTRSFFMQFRGDVVIFWKDVKVTIIDQGWLTNSVLIGLMFIALVLRLNNLDLPLGHDEAYMFNAFASRSFWHIVTNYHLPNNHVLLSIIIKIATGIFGNHIWSLRLPTIIAGVFMVPASYYFGKRFYSLETGLLSSIFVATFPILVQYSVYARGYALIALITLWLFTLADYVRIKKNRFVWFLIVLLSAMGFFTIPIMLFPFGALYRWFIGTYVLKDISSYEPKSEFLKYWLGSGIAAAILTILLYTPIMIYSYERFFGNGFVAPVGWDLFPITIWTRLRNTWLDWTEFVPLWATLLGVVGFFVSLIFHKRFSRQKLPPQLAFILWIVTMLIVRRPDMQPRFWLFMAAPILIWSAAGIVEPLKGIMLKIGKERNVSQVFLTIALVAFFIQGLFAIPSLPSQVQKKDDAAKAALYLKNYLQQDDLVTASVANLPAMRYYFNYYDIPHGIIREAGEFQRAFVIVDSNLGETLLSNVPKLGYDIPAVNMETARILAQFDYLTVYECDPAQ